MQNQEQFIIKNLKKRDLIVPKNIKLNYEILRCFYYLVGDGSFKKGVYLSNINPKLHKDFIRVFEKYFDLTRKDWIISITNNEKTKIKHIRKTKHFWEKTLEVEKIHRKYKTKFNTNKLGAVKTIYDSINFSRYLLKHIEGANSKILNNSLSQKSLCIILDGILNAEGGASIDKNCLGIHKTTISFNNHDKKEEELFSKVLENLNLLKYSRIEQERRFTFSKWINNYQFLKTFTKNNIIPFSLYPERAIKLFSGFLNHQRTQSINKYLGIINKKDNLTLKEITILLDHDKSSIERAFLRKFKPFGFFTLSGKGINRNPYKVSITLEGKLFLNTTRKAKIWLNKALKQKHKDQIKMEKIFVKKESDTNPKYGCKPDERTIDQLLSYGIVNINKPAGPSSHQVTDYVKKILGIEKAGHSGTLA